MRNLVVMCIPAVGLLAAGCLLSPGESTWDRGLNATSVK
jgi:hypothetical protein